ncbi:MAG: efflux RND transporter periplasmic adaptor subunit [Candidatus Moranbacteria bacterium]|nr:efflux RND transporter periplasmic adaptor subunit [Candidatus Moranbacteria bacterium]
MSKNRFKKAILISIVVLAVSSFYVVNKLYVSGYSQEAETSGAIVKTIVAGRSGSGSQIEFSGFIRGAQRANIAPMANGRILKIYKREGDFARQGETIATIDPNQAGATADATNNNVDALKKTLGDTKDYYDQVVKQTKKTNDESAIKSAKRARDLQIQMVKDQIIAAQGAANVAQVGLDNAVLTAPFSGTITSMSVHEGDFAVMGMPLASIDSSKNFEVETYVSSNDGNNIPVGSVAQIQAGEGNKIAGTVISVSPAIDTQNLKTLIRVHIDDVTENVHLGDFARGAIEISNNNQSQIEIPRKAIISRGGDPVVFVVDDEDVATERVVKLGDEQNGGVVVTDGISEGEKVVIEGQFNLINNMTVKPYAAS